jgi:hypothetical protein
VRAAGDVHGAWPRDDHVALPLDLQIERSLTTAASGAAPAGLLKLAGSRGHRAPIGCTPKRDTGQPANTKAQLKAAKQPLCPSQRANAESRRLASVACGRPRARDRRVIQQRGTATHARYGHPEQPSAHAPDCAIGEQAALRRWFASRCPPCTLRAPSTGPQRASEVWNGRQGAAETIRTTAFPQSTGINPLV